VLSIAKEFLLLNCVVSSVIVPLPNGVAYSESVSLLNRVICSESAFAAKIVLSIVNL
jgi:hypothetical protein